MRSSDFLGEVERMRGTCWVWREGDAVFLPQTSPPDPLSPRMALGISTIGRRGEGAIDERREEVGQGRLREVAVVETNEAYFCG